MDSNDLPDYVSICVELATESAELTLQVKQWKSLANKFRDERDTLAKKLKEYTDDATSDVEPEGVSNGE